MHLASPLLALGHDIGEVVRPQTQRRENGGSNNRRFFLPFEEMRHCVTLRYTNMLTLLFFPRAIPPHMFIDDLTTFRISARLKKTQLANLCGIDRVTVTRIERHDRTTIETAGKIIDVLNEHHFSKNGKTPLNANVVITPRSRYGTQ